MRAPGEHKTADARQGDGRSFPLPRSLLLQNFSDRLCPGGSPGAGDFLLRGQKKLTKEKAALVSRHSRGVPVLLDEPGGCGTRPRQKRARAQTVLTDDPRLACVTRRLTREPGSNGVAKDTAA